MMLAVLLMYYNVSCTHQRHGTYYHFKIYKIGGTVEPAMSRDSYEQPASHGRPPAHSPK